MNGKDLLDKSKEVVTDIVDTVEEQLENATDAVSEAVNNIEEAIHNNMPKKDNLNFDMSRFGSGLSKAMSKPLSSMKSAVERKVEESIGEVEQSLPILRRAGFDLVSVDIEIGTMPKVVPRFIVTHDVGPQTRVEIESEAKGHRMTRILLELLLKTKLMLNFSISDLKFHQIEVHLGAMPKASVRYVK